MTRVQKFAKYLSQFDWILTVTIINLPVSIRDNALLEKLNDRKQICQFQASQTVFKAKKSIKKI